MQWEGLWLCVRLWGNRPCFQGLIFFLNPKSILNCLEVRGFPVVHCIFSVHTPCLRTHLIGILASFLFPDPGRVVYCITDSIIFLFGIYTKYKQYSLRRVKPFKVCCLLSILLSYHLTKVYLEVLIHIIKIHLL